MKQTPWLGYSIDRGNPVPVFEQICRAIRASVSGGDLVAGQTLPPTRAFATELGVSRSTVVTAYEQLVAEGYLNSVQGSGHRVNAAGTAGLPASQPGRVATPGPPEEKPPMPLPFRAGTPDMRLFPHRQWAKTVARICRSNPEALLSGGSGFGCFDLRRAIAGHVSEWRGLEASPHQVIITAGSTDALELCIRTLGKQGDRIGLENPGYRPLRNFVTALRYDITDLDVDDGGAVTPPVKDPCRLVVLTPSHQFPLGGAMSPGRRMEFIRWAETRRSWIIEDDYDSEFRYAGRPIPALAGFDQLNRTLYVGSFSKIFSGGLRLGYIVVPEGLTGAFRTTLQRFGVKAGLMPQQALADFIECGEFYRHLRRVRRIYAERRRFLTAALSRDFAEVGHFTDHQAGMQVAFHLNKGFSDTEIARQAQAAGLTVEALSDYCSDANRVNGLLLGFCAFKVEEMAPALAALRKILT